MSLDSRLLRPLCRLLSACFRSALPIELRQAEAGAVETLHATQWVPTLAFGAWLACWLQPRCWLW